MCLNFKFGGDRCPVATLSPSHNHLGTGNPTAFVFGAPLLGRNRSKKKKKKKGPMGKSIVLKT